jgi:hypothetical protein
MTRAEAVRLIETARTPADLFGSAGTREYRRLARLVHPDTGGPREAFDRLTALWHAHGPATIETRHGTYAPAPAPIRGDLANLYDAGEAMVKIPRDPAVNDLLEREAIALRQLPQDGDGRFLPYVPRLLESFRHRDEATGAERRANVLARLAGFHPLTEVRAAYPGGADAWRLLAELDDLLERLYGPRRFRPFHLPDVSTERT